MAEGELLDFLTEHGVGAADQLRKKQNEESEGREMLAATRKALAAASTQGRTNEGRRTFQTILTAAAFDGDGPSKVTAKRKAELLGVHPEHFVGANRRVARLRSDLAPEEALAEGPYWFQPRGKRSDATPPELLELMKRFWHTNEVSRASGNSSNRDMWRPSRGRVRSPTLVGNSTYRAAARQLSPSFSSGRTTSTSRGSENRRRTRTSRILVALCSSRRGASA